MPEGPEVRTITDKLSARLRGKILLRMGWDSTSKYSEGLSGYDNLILPYLPLTIENVTCKGKQIFFHLIKILLIDEQSHIYRVYLNSTLGMEGKWVWKSDTHSNFWLTVGDSVVDALGSDRLPISLIVRYQVVYFDDVRHYGNLTLKNEQGYQDKLTEIGPDLLTEEVAFPTWLDKARHKRIENKQICDFLMDQKYFSGIGNYLKAEVLYKAKIRPDRILGDLTDDDLKRILMHSMTIIRLSYSYGGLTIKSYWDPDGNKGRYPREVYEKETDLLGNPVIKSKFKDGRTTHWVPTVQI